jgi:putative hemolysin
MSYLLSAEIAKKVQSFQAPPLNFNKPRQRENSLLEIRVAKTKAEIQGAQRLRYQVFTEEYGAIIRSTDGHDQDALDSFCKHLIVIDTDTQEVVGTYRVLNSSAAKDYGCLHAESVFNIERLDPLRNELAEFGRSCVRSDYRDARVIRLLLTGLGKLLAQSGERYVLGCIPIDARDGGLYAASIYQALAPDYLSNDSLRIWPRNRPTTHLAPTQTNPIMPPFLKAYLRAGAVVLGEPHCNLELGIADLPILLPINHASAAYQSALLNAESA